MLRLLNKILGITPRQPQIILENRQWLRKRQQQNLQIASKMKSNPQILQLSLQQLSKLKGDKISAFASRCSLPQNKKLNFLADMNIKGAQQLNPQGIPFTVKDQLKVNNMISTCGYGRNISPQYQNTQVVDMLIKQGLVPYAHTNLPQGLLGIDSVNNVYGNAVNPYNPQFICGGSSGGEGVSVATRCSPLGIASDSAGSARIPAAFCGVVGFKPTGSKRLSKAGRLSASGRQGYTPKDLDSSIGFITRNVQDLSWVCQKTLGKGFNGYVQGQWNQKKFEQYKNKKLKIGYIIEDHEMKAVPAVRNSILQSVKLLREQNHQVVEFNFPQLYKFRDFTFKILASTGAINGMGQLLQGQKPVKQLQWIQDMLQFGKYGILYKTATASHPIQKATLPNYIHGNTFKDMAQLCQVKDILKKNFLKTWKQSGIDVLLTPVLPFTAPLKNPDPWLLNQLTFQAFPNVLQLPAGTVPVRLVKQQQTNYQDGGFYQHKISSSIKQSKGLPVGVQFVAPHMQDQVCIAAMHQLQSLLPKLPRPTPQHI